MNKSKYIYKRMLNMGNGQASTEREAELKMSVNDAFQLLGSMQQLGLQGTDSKQTRKEFKKGMKRIHKIVKTLSICLTGRKWEPGKKIK